MTNLENMKSTELKEMAKQLGIKNWWKLTKAQLQNEIEHNELMQEPIEETIPSEVEPATSENLITLKELTMEAKVKGTKARRLLRNNNIERPFKRWEWDKDLHKDIIKQIRDLLK